MESPFNMSLYDGGVVWSMIEIFIIVDPKYCDNRILWICLIFSNSVPQCTGDWRWVVGDLLVFGGWRLSSQSHMGRHCDTRPSQMVCHYQPVEETCGHHYKQGWIDLKKLLLDAKTSLASCQRCRQFFCFTGTIHQHPTGIRPPLIWTGKLWREKRVDCRQ